MPWWGWLILGCVALVVAGYLTAFLVATFTAARQMRAQREADERRWSRRPGGGLW